MIVFSLKKGEEKHKYGQQRAWGSIGRGLIAIVSGVSVDWFSKGQDYKNYTPIFIISLMCNLLNIYVATKIDVNINYFYTFFNSFSIYIVQNLKFIIIIKPKHVMIIFYCKKEVRIL